MFRLVMITAVLTLLGCKEDDVVEVNPCPKLKAYAFVKEQVTKKLTSPGSAIFPADPPPPLFANSDVIIARKGDCIYGVSSWVDSQNGFGGLRRTNFSSDVSYNQSTLRWKVDSIILAPY